ncbi:unnamed protein product, partial [Prorocentrum cordatum]
PGAVAGASFLAGAGGRGQGALPRQPPGAPGGSHEQFPRFHGGASSHGAGWGSHPPYLAAVPGRRAAPGRRGVSAGPRRARAPSAAPGSAPPSDERRCEALLASPSPPTCHDRSSGRGPASHPAVSVAGPQTIRPAPRDAGDDLPPTQRYPSVVLGSDPALHGGTEAPLAPPGMRSRSRSPARQREPARSAGGSPSAAPIWANRPPSSTRPPSGPWRIHPDIPDVVATLSFVQPNHMSAVARIVQPRPDLSLDRLGGLRNQSGQSVMLFAGNRRDGATGRLCIPGSGSGRPNFPPLNARICAMIDWSRTPAAPDKAVPTVAWWVHGEAPADPTRAAPVSRFTLHSWP